MLLCSHAPGNNYSPTAGLRQKNDGYLSSFLSERQAADKLNLYNLLKSYTKCSMGRNSSSHMLKRQPWTKESLVVYSANINTYTARLRKNQWLLVQKVVHLLKKVLGSWAMKYKYLLRDSCSTKPPVALLQKRCWNGHACNKSMQWKRAPLSVSLKIVNSFKINPAQRDMVWILGQEKKLL